MIQFKKAVRTRVKLKVLITGPSGSGKTLGGLTLASHIAPGKVAGIDSEHDRMLYYADRVPFDHLSLSGVTPQDYMDAVDAAVAAGFEVVMIDSLSHCWNDLLERKNEHERVKGGNSFVLWGIYGAEWEKMVKHLLAAPIHVIATSRSKQAYEQTTDERGKKKVEKLGLAPQVRDGAEYEFAVSFDLTRAHRAECTKDNTGLFSAEHAMWDLCDPDVAHMLKSWMDSGATIDPMAQRNALADLLDAPSLTDEERGEITALAVTEADAQRLIGEVKAAIAERAAVAV